MDLDDLEDYLCNYEKEPKSNIPPQLSGERSGEPSPTKIVIDSGGKASSSMVGHQPNENVNKDGKDASFSHMSSSLHNDGAENHHLSKSEGENLEDASAEMKHRSPAPTRDDQLKEYGDSKVPSQEVMLDVAKMNGAKRGDQAASKPEGAGGGHIWTKEEHNLFEIGCITYGWGEWRAVQEMIPSRNRKEVKSYAKIYNKQHPETRKRLQGEHERQQRLLPSTGPDIGTTFGKQKSPSIMTGSFSLWRGTTMGYKTGMTGLNPPENLPIPKKVTDVFVPPLSTISKGMKYWPDEDKIGDNLSWPLLSHSTKSDYMSTVAKSHESTAAPDPASMNSSEDTPILHAWRQTSTTDAFDHASSSPMKKKYKNKLYSSFEETPSKEGYWTNEEHSQFEKGIILYGWGNWKRVESCIPTRNKVQIKTHAQKFSRCRPSQKDRLVSMYEEHAHSLQLSKDLQSSSKRRDLSKARPLPLTKRNQQDTGWSIIEKKQFEDGCVFHGWGSWYDIAAQIITKDIDQVLKYAGAYDCNDIERLRGEHTLKIQTDNNALIDQDPKTSTQKFQHVPFPGGLKSPQKPTIETDDEDESSSDDDESEDASQPPPSWLAMDNWDTVLANIQRWNNRLTENERSMEYERYDSLSEKEKDRLLKKLMRLLQSRPSL